MPGLAHIQYGDHYPLVDPSDDIKYLIDDLTISYENPQWEYTLPLSIAYFDKLKGRLKIKNEKNSIIFDATANSIREWGGKYKIFSWNTAGFSIKMAINTEIDTASVIQPQNAVIDLRAVFLSPPHITSINGYKGDIEFEAGYNVSFKHEDSTEELRQGVQIDMDAVAGKGKGVKSREALMRESTGLKFLAGAQADENGAVRMNGEGGPQVTAECHSISIGNSNTPCCHCEDMENLGTYMTAVSEKYKILGAYTKWIYQKYVGILNQWKNRCADASEDEEEEKPVTGLVKPPVAIKLWLVPGSCPYVRLKIQITNLNKVAWCDLKLTGTFTPTMCRISEIYTTTTASEGKMLVWVDDVIKDVQGRYAESTYTANRFPVQLRDMPHATKCEFGEVHWQGNIAPGESVFYQADFKMETHVPPRRPVDIEFHIDSIVVEYADGTGTSLSHNTQYPNLATNCTFGNTNHGILSQPALLNGHHKIVTTIDCNERIDDTVENPDRVEDIRDEIYQIRENLWPCEEDLANAGNIEQ